MSDAVVTSPMRPGDSSGAWDGVTPPAVTTRHFCKQVVCVCAQRRRTRRRRRVLLFLCLNIMLYLLYQVKAELQSCLVYWAHLLWYLHRIFLIITFIFFQKGSERNIWNLCRF